MSEKLLAIAIELLESGDDTGCEGLIVVSNDAFVFIQQVVQAHTGIQYGVNAT
jgi:hypothetical protein